MNYGNKGNNGKTRDSGKLRDSGRTKDNENTRNSGNIRDSGNSRNKKNVQKTAKILMVMIVILVLAAVTDINRGELSESYAIKRNKPGESSKEIDLILNGEGISNDYQYRVIVEPMNLSDEEVDRYINRAKKEIDEEVFGDEEASCVTKDLVIDDHYADGLVEADWTFSDYSIIDVDGSIISEKLAMEGTVLTAQIQLTCQDKEEIYEFPFVVYPKDMSDEEKIIYEINQELEKDMAGTGDSIYMPMSINGKGLKWAERSSHTVAKVFVFEIIIGVLLRLIEKERENNERKKREQLLRYDYSDIVSKMAILVGSGMTIRESWHKIATRYSDEGQKSMHPAYQEMLYTINEIRDGVSEKIAYQRFGERTGIGEYHRFSRSIVQNLQKGNRGMCDYLEKEATTAFEEKKLMAKKLGEEAGTKMLGPLLVMLAIVIAIVVAPAVVSFSM